MNDKLNATEDERTANNYGRHQYRKLSDEEKALVSGVKDATHDFGKVLDALPDSREKSIAIRKMVEASMWAVRGLTK